MSPRFSVKSVLAVLVFCCCCTPVTFAQYAGPSILSRGGNQPGRRGRAPVNFTGYLGGGYRYESGLLAPVLNRAGEVAGIDDYGYYVEGGLYGGHDWRNISAGLDYRGDYRWQERQKYYNGSNHVLAFDATFRPSKRWLLTATETGGTTNRAFGGFAAPAFAESGRLGVPVGELFDVRTYFAQTGLQAAWQQSARTTFSVGASGFFVKRQNLALINAQGYEARAAVRHRLTRSDTVGLDYQFVVFEFPHAFARSQGHGLQGSWTRRVNRNMEASGSLGFMRLTTAGTETVQLSPAVAAVLGRATTLASFIRSTTFPSGAASVRYMLQRSVLSGTFSSSVGAGNGVFLTSRQTTANIGYSYTGIRRTSMGVSAGWYQTSSVAVNLGSLHGYQAGAGFSYRLAEGLNLTSQTDYRVFSGGNVPSRSGVSFLAGLSWSTSRLPLSIW